MEFFDSHSHYNDERFDEDRDVLIEDVHKEGITKLLCAGYSIQASEQAIEIAEKYPFIYSSVGISPNDIDEIVGKKLDEILEKTQQLAKNEKVVAIGEIGLDYYWNKENKELQKEMFIKQIDIANKLSLPIIIHTREAAIDTIDILKNKIDCEQKGVFHCCPLNQELIKEALKLDFYISFAGPITYKNSKNAGEIIRYVPLEKIALETDSPYLSPEPLRGKRNDSRNIKYIANKVAEVKGLEVEEIARITYENTKRLFKIN